MDLTTLSNLTLCVYGVCSIPLLIILGYICSNDESNEQAEIPAIETQTNLSNNDLVSFLTEVENFTTSTNEAAGILVQNNEMLILAARQLNVQRHEALLEQIDALMQTNQLAATVLMDQSLTLLRRVDHLNDSSVPNSPQDLTMAEDTISLPGGSAEALDHDYGIIDMTLNALKSIVDMGSTIIGFFF